MKHITYILKLVGTYILGVVGGTAVGCLRLGKLYLSDYPLCTILGPAFQPKALFSLWGDKYAVLEQIALGIGIILFSASIIIAKQKHQKNHVLWGLFAFVFTISISTAAYVLSMVY